MESNRKSKNDIFLVDIGHPLRGVSCLSTIKAVDK